MRIVPIMIKSLLLAFLMTVITSVYAVPNNTLRLSPIELKWLKDNPVIVAAFDGDFPPYSFVNDEDKLEGFSVDVLKLISEKVGFSLRIAPERIWKKLYDAAKSSSHLPEEERGIDIVATMVNHENRRKWFHFTSPYILKSLVIINREDDKSINHKEDIINKKVALVKGYHYVDRILEEYPTIKPVFVDSMLDALNAVSVGDADATISFLGAGHYYRNKYLLTNLKYAAVFDKSSANESIAVRKNAPILAGIIQKALNTIPEGELQVLRQKWLPVDYMEHLIEINLTKKELAWIKKHRNIRLGVDPEFAPFEFIEDEKYQGMTSDYVKLLNQRLNLNMTIVKNISWNEVIQRMERGDIDVLPAVGLTAERQNIMKYTAPYLQFHRVIVTRKDAPYISGVEDIDHIPVAVQINSSHHGYLSENTHVNIMPFHTLQEALLAVSSGQVSVFVGNVASASYWIQKMNLTNLRIAAPVSTELQNLHFAVRKDWPELSVILQKGLNSISPRQQKLISEKWLSESDYPIVDYSLIWKIIAVSLTLISLSFVWNQMLKRQVKLRTEQLNYTANYDQLSGLPNRFLMMDRLQQTLHDAHRNNGKVALLSVDIDDFNNINEGFDHKTGDKLILNVSQRLQSNLRESDIVGSLGVDHFLVGQNRINDMSEVALLAENLLTCLNQPFTIDGKEITISVSLGIAVFPDDGSNVEDLIKRANAATHHSKSQGQGSYTFYTSNLIQNVSRRLELERHMRGALERFEFNVFFQPKVDTKSRKITSFEALLRWSNSELGQVSPVEFIPIAERNGLIEPLGSFVIEQALSQLAIWKKRYGADFSMAINLSPVQFRSDNLVPHIESTLLKNGLSGKDVEFEITEGVLLSKFTEVDVTLKRLEALGINLSMDDFGTGYSSMSYLRKYKFNLLKIDGEFINNVVFDAADQKLVSATIAMAHGLGMKVVAERIETEEQYSWLKEANCDLLQGWLFSKACSAKNITELLDETFTLRER